MTRWPTKPLREVLVQRLEECRIADGSKETFVTVRLYGKGAVPRKIGDGKTPVMKTGYRLRSGDLVYSRIDARNGAFALVSRELNGAVVSKDFPSFTIHRDRVHPGFLTRFLSTEQFFSQLQASSFGTTNRQRITEELLLSYEIPVPPLVEQERIVKLLDEADELRRLRARADRRTADLIPSLFHDMFGNAGHMRDSARPLSEVAEVVSGVAKGRRFNGQKPITVPYIRVANVQAGYLDLAEIKTIEALPAEVQELTLKNGDVLLTEGGDFDKLGRGALWEYDIPNCIHQNHVFRVRVEPPKLLPIYFEKFLQTPKAKRYFLGCAKRTTNLASINMTQLRGLPVPVPPLSLQRDFAARVAEIRAMKTQQAASRRRLDDLFQSMLHRAFQGGL